MMRSPEKVIDLRRVFIVLHKAFGIALVLEFGVLLDGFASTTNFGEITLKARTWVGVASFSIRSRPGHFHSLTAHLQRCLVHHHYCSLSILCCAHGAV
jgi:hypothetical protein